MERISRIFFGIFIAVLFSLSLASCLSIDASAKVDANGSGTISIHYQIAEEYVALGSHESTSTLPLPLSKHDIEQSLYGVPGIELKSYSMSKKSNDTIVSFSLSFDSPEQLATYLDPTATLVHYKKEQSRSMLMVSFGDEIQTLDPQMKEYFTDAFRPYSFKLTFEASKGSPAISILNNDFLKVSVSGNKSIIEASMADLLISSQAAKIIISWE